MKNKNLYNDILDALIEKVIPSIVNNLQEMGMDNFSSAIFASFSLPIFKYINQEFPYQIDDLPKVKTADNQEQIFVVLNINSKGELIISKDVRTNELGLTELTEPILISDNAAEAFKNMNLNTQLLFYFSNELTQRVKVQEADKLQMIDLFENMNKVNLKLTRKTLMEKK